MKMKPAFYGVLFLAALLITSIGIGSAQAAKKQTKLLDSQLEELQLHLKAFNIRFSNSVAQTADRIAAKTDDTVIYRNTLLWKIKATSFAQRLLYENPPLSNYILTWALCKKMVFAFEDGSDKKNFGKWQPEAIQTAKRLEREIRGIGLYMRDEKSVDELEQLLNQNIKNQKGLISYYDVSLNPSFVAWIEKLEKAKGYKESLQSVDEGIQTLNRQLSHFAESFPRMARWQAEYLMAGKSEEIIDHFFKRLVQFVLFLSFLFALGYGFHAWRTKRK
jgi:hypothetical protein